MFPSHERYTLAFRSQSLLNFTCRWFTQVKMTIIGIQQDVLSLYSIVIQPSLGLGVPSLCHNPWRQFNQLIFVLKYQHGDRVIDTLYSMCFQQTKYGATGSWITVVTECNHVVLLQNKVSSGVKLNLLLLTISQ